MILQADLNLVNILEAAAKYVPEEHLRDFLNELNLDLEEYELDSFNDDEISAMIKFDSEHPKANLLTNYINSCDQETILEFIECYVDDFDDLSESTKNIIIENLSNIDLDNYDIIESVLFTSPFIHWYNDNINIQDMPFIDLSEFDLNVMSDSLLSLETIRTYFRCYIQEQTNWFTLDTFDNIYFNGIKGLSTNLAENYPSGIITVDWLNEERLFMNKEELKKYINDNIDDPYYDNEYEKLYCDAAAQILVHYLS